MRAKMKDLQKKIHSDLKKHSVSCWFAPENLPIGARHGTEIDKVIAEQDSVIVILSKYSIEN